MPIVWDKSIAIDIEEIDDQHHVFIDLIAKLETAIAEKSTREHITEVFEGLREYIDFHFSTEEKHFDEFGCYPDAEKHKAVHKAFAEHVTDIRYRFQGNHEELTVELARSMYDWLINHIKHMDRDYAECFKSKGL